MTVDRESALQSRGVTAPGSLPPPPLAAGGKTSRPEGSPTPLQGGTRTPSRATPRNQASRDGTREGVPHSPAGGELPSNSLPAGSRGLRGAEWRKEAAKASRRRPARVTVSTAAKAPSVPPVTGGAALTATANCIGRCDWTAGPGGPAEVDKLAEKHTTKPPEHPTNVVSEVAP